jgi:hypothetical protein
MTRQHKTTQHKTRQDKTRQDKARKKRHDKTRQDKTRQDKTRQDKTRQGKTRQGKTRQYKTRQGNKATQPKRSPNGSYVIDRSILDRFYFPSKYLYFLVTYSVQIYPYNERMGKKAKKLGQKLPFLLLYVIRRFHKLPIRFKTNRLLLKDAGFRVL